VTLLAGAAVLTIVLDPAWLARLGWLTARRRPLAAAIGVVVLARDPAVP
jgi:hypothetical protein